MESKQQNLEIVKTIIVGVFAITACLVSAYFFYHSGVQAYDLMLNEMVARTRHFPMY